MTSRDIDQATVDYVPARGELGKARGNPASVNRAIEKHGALKIATVIELLELLEAKTDYAFHVEVATQSPRGGLVKTIDNERDALETIRRLKLVKVKP